MGTSEAAFETGAVAADVEWIAFAELERRSYRGREGFVEFMSTWTEDFEDFSVQADQLIDAGDSVVALLTQSGTGKASGAPVVQEYALIYDLADGQVVRIRGILTVPKPSKPPGCRSRPPPVNTGSPDRRRWRVSMPSVSPTLAVDRRGDSASKSSRAWS